MKRTGSLLLFIVFGFWFLFSPPPIAGGADAGKDAGFLKKIASDWLRQAEVRGAANLKTVTPESDAMGAVDGIKNGLYGFHTALENKPWWQVDLGRSQVLSKVTVYNRCITAERAGRLCLLVSDDGGTWREVYRHDGRTFYGVTDQKPLVVIVPGVVGRYLRVQLPDKNFLHLDEVEVYGAAEPSRNLAWHRPALQSSVSEWSVSHATPPTIVEYPLRETLGRGLKLAGDLANKGVDTKAQRQILNDLAREYDAMGDGASTLDKRRLYLQIRQTIRSLAFSNPLLDFDRILFVTSAFPWFAHMSDQYYGWWSRPGGGLYLLENIKSDAPKLTSLTRDFAPGAFLRPDLSYDGKKVLFAYCKHYPEVADLPDKFNKRLLPEDSFYHLYEMSLDGASLRQLTHGRYDDFDGRYLPDGQIVFLSTRRGQFVQTGRRSAMDTVSNDALPDCFVRCGGDNSRPVSVYTLHLMDGDGGNLRATSSFEMFEWTPSVAQDGRLLYARWDYVDRNNMPYMSLWAANPDGSNARTVYGNYTTSPHCKFEARSVPGSHKIVFTASAHHCYTGGSLVLLDPWRGMEGPEPLKRLTPEVSFPEAEAWPATWYASPWPLSEDYYLTAWSDQPLGPYPHKLPTVPGTNTANWKGWYRSEADNSLGIYLYDAFGNLELIHRDPQFSALCPIPVKTRPKPAAIPEQTAWEGPQEGRFLLTDVYRGLSGVERGRVKQLRVVGIPVKTQPHMNTPNLGLTADDPGKFVLGTVPVEADGSAYFRVPSGLTVFFQALDADGFSLQTMRSGTYVHPDQTLSCVGCHESRLSTPINHRSLAAARKPSKITLGPEGSWPLRFDRLVQPVLDRYCAGCHEPKNQNRAVARLNLCVPASYESLVDYGKPSLREHVKQRYYAGSSTAGQGAAATSALWSFLRRDELHRRLNLDPQSQLRLIVWMDTYAQRLGAFSDDQEKRLAALRHNLPELFIQSRPE